MTKLYNMCRLIVDTLTQWTSRFVDVLDTEVGTLIDIYLDGIVENIADLFIPSAIENVKLYVLLFSASIFVFVFCSLVGLLKKLLP